MQTGFNGAVTIALANNPDSGKLNGTLTTNAKAGVAIFSQLTLDQAANGDTIQATSSGLIAATTNSFNVTPAAASALTIANLPASVLAGTAQNIAVTAYDTYGNIATGYTGTIKFTSSDAKAILPASYQFVAANKGTHSFSVTFHDRTAIRHGHRHGDREHHWHCSYDGDRLISAAFVCEATTTQGNWIGAYGSQGYDIVSGPTSLPSYAALTPAVRQLIPGVTQTSRPHSNFRAVPIVSPLSGIRQPAFRSTLVSPMARRTISLCTPATMTTWGGRNRFRSRTPQPEQSSTRRDSPVSPAGSISSGGSPAVW